MGPIMKPLVKAVIVAMVLAGTANLQVSFAAGPRSLAPLSTTPNADYVAGKAAVDAGDYEAAIAHLGKAVAANPADADALNYLGYSHRRLGNLEESLNWYRKALAVNPNHRGALEYLGELYLEMDQPEQAEQQLATLGRVCIFGCPEYDELKEAIDDYRAGQ